MPVFTAAGKRRSEQGHIRFARSRTGPVRLMRYEIRSLGDQLTQPRVLENQGLADRRETSNANRI